MLVSVLAGFSLLVFVPPAGADPNGPHADVFEGAQVSLLAADAQINAVLPSFLASETSRVAILQLDLEPGWKTYWRLAGRFGFSPELAWQGSQNLGALAVHMPAPGLFEEGGGLSIGYDQPVQWLLLMEPDNPDAPVELNLTLNFGLCETLCIVETAQLSLSVSPFEQVENRPWEELQRVLRTVAALDGWPGVTSPPVTSLTGDDTLSADFAPLELEQRGSAQSFLIAEGPHGNHAVLQWTGQGERYTGTWRYEQPPETLHLIIESEKMRSYALDMTAQQIAQ